MTSTKILVIGFAGHGKDSVGEILAKFGFSFLASSSFATSRIMMPYFESTGNPYANDEECFADRVNHRSTWYDQIELYNKPTWTRVTEEMFADGIYVYVGMRSRKEFEASRSMFDHIVWVDASKRLPPENTSSNTLSISDATYVIDNNGPESALLSEVVKFLDTTKSTPGDIGSGCWNHDSIRTSVIEKRKDAYASMSHDELVERAIALETALYPFVYTLGGLDEKSPRGTWANSKLFASDFDGHDRFTTFEGGKGQSFKHIPDSCLHSVDYAEEDSITISDGTILSDSFNILGVQQEFFGGQASCGRITMGDVRIAKSLVFEKSKTDT